MEQIDQSTITSVMEKPLRWRFVPCRDITAWEFACLHPYLHHQAPLDEAAWKDLGDANRHLERV